MDYDHGNHYDYDRDRDYDHNYGYDYDYDYDRYHDQNHGYGLTFDGPDFLGIAVDDGHAHAGLLHRWGRRLDRAAQLKVSSQHLHISHSILVIAY